MAKQFSRSIIFSPEKLTGTKLFATSREFSAPYKAVNLLFMSNPYIKYVIIGNNNVNEHIASEINKSIPDKWNKEFYTAMPNIKHEANTKYRLIFTSLSPSQTPIFPNEIQGMPDDDVTALKVNGDILKGDLTFYSKKEHHGNCKENQAT